MTNCTNLLLIYLELASRSTDSHKILKVAIISIEVESITNDRCQMLVSLEKSDRN